MAALLGAQAGKAPFLMNATAIPAQNFGTPANSAALAGAVQITLPVDPQGNAYKAYQISTSGSIWFNFNSDNTNPTVAGTSCYLTTQANATVVVPPVGTTKIGAIPATGSTTPDVCVIGLY